MIIKKYNFSVKYFLEIRIIDDCLIKQSIILFVSKLFCINSFKLDPQTIKQNIKDYPNIPREEYKKVIITFHAKTASHA